MLIAVDPGQNTGMAFRLDNGAWFTMTIEKVPSAAERFDMVLGMLLEQFQKQPVEALVLESFQTMSRYLSKYGLETIELVGAIRAVCYCHATPVTTQVPMVRIPMERQATKLLKDCGRHYTDHEVSALSHLLAYEHRQTKARASA